MNLLNRKCKIIFLIVQKAWEFTKYCLYLIYNYLILTVFYCELYLLTSPLSSAVCFLNKKSNTKERTMVHKRMYAFLFSGTWCKISLGFSGRCLILTIVDWNKSPSVLKIILMSMYSIHHYHYSINCKKNLLSVCLTILYENHCKLVYCCCWKAVYKIGK